MAEKPEDLNLPTSIVTKIIKDCLPASCKVSKEANAAITKVKHIHCPIEMIFIKNICIYYVH